MKKKEIISLTIFSLASVLLGVVLTLTIPALRYTTLSPVPKATTIAPEKVYKHMEEDKEGSLFIDVRPEAEFKTIHPVNAKNVEMQTLFDEATIAKLAQDSQGKELYITCKSGALAGVAYRVLQLHGFTNIHRVDGGITGWIEKGLPTAQ